MLIKGQNSYVDLAEAEDFFANRLDVAAWSEASDSDKEKALTTATAMLDGYEWVGQVVDPLQPLAFPRTGQYYDKRLGMLAPLNPTPVRIEQACYELAYHLLNNDGLLDDTGEVESISVGSVSLSGIKSGSRTPPLVKNLFKDMLVNGGTNHWWRAN